MLYEQGRGGAAVVDVARTLAEEHNATLTVVGIAPRAPSGPRCGNSAVEYNQAVADSVAHDLQEARDRLGAGAEFATFVLLIEGAGQTFEQFVRSGGFDLVLLPARRRPLRGAYHPEASRLGVIAGAAVRIVSPASLARPLPQRRGDGAG